MSFQKPGSRSQSAFGVSFKSRNRPSQDDNAPSTSGRQEPVHDEPPFKRAKLSLPVARYKRQILYLLETHATVVIVGETGCGKTTQIPQYLHKAGWTAEGYQVSACSHEAICYAYKQPHIDHHTLEGLSSQATHAGYA